MNIDEVRVAIVEGCRRLEAGGLVAGASGNVSVRLPEADGKALFAITPSQVRYAVLQPEQVLVIDYDRNIIDGDGKTKPSSETVTHLAAYRARRLALVERIALAGWHTLVLARPSRHGRVRHGGYRTTG